MKSQESRLEVNEKRMTRWMCGVKKKDENQKELDVALVIKKIAEERLNVRGH